MKQNKDNSLFKSATIRLTGWYLLILMSLSILFSIVIYTITCSEVALRLDRFQQNIQQSQYVMTHMTEISSQSLVSNELNEARKNLIIELTYVNVLVLLAGGLASYLLARHNLTPIEKAHESQSRFTSDASHELRTPLAVMKTEIEVALRNKKNSTKELRSTLSSNLEEVDKLSKLAEMLLNLSRLDNHGLEFKKIDFTKLVGDTIVCFKKPMERIKLAENKPIIIKGNEDALADLVKILIDNALKYSPEDSLVTIKLSSSLRSVVMEIRNSGAGIKPEKIKHIFDRFYRADDSRTTGKNKSFGLGLALAKKIVDVHQGIISVKSIPNKETIFTVSIPLNVSIKKSH